MRRKSEENIGASNGSASKESRIKSSSLSHDVRSSASIGVSGQIKDIKVTPRPNQRQAGTKSQKASYRIRKIGIETVKGQKHLLRGGQRKAAELRSIKRVQEMTERHQLGDSVTVRRYLKRDVPLKKPQETEKPADGDADVVARNRVGAPIVRKIFTSFPIDATADDNSKARGES